MKSVMRVALLFLASLTWSLPGWAGYVQLDAVADIKTRFSAGCSTVQELANLARHRGIDVVIYSDNDRRSLEYGIVPFEGIFKKKRTYPSILTSGAASYLAEINGNDQNFDDILLIPAVESAPFYFWSGNLSEKNLTANNWDKHLLILGMDRPEDYEQLPILNSNFSKKYFDLFFKPFIIYVGVFLVFLILYFKRFARKTAFFLMIVSGLLAINYHPFKSSQFDAYHGDPGVAPYQELIDYARSRNALVFWNHLEATENVGKEGAMGFKTLPHAEDLVLSRGYTGFQAVYDGKSQATEPGKHWDQVLMDYVSGNRKEAAWGYGGNDFHCEGDGGHIFGGVRTVLLVREKTRKAVLDALKSGRMYAVKQSGDHRLSLDHFSIADQTTKQVATLGESLLATNYPEIKIKLRSTEGAEKPFTLSIVRNGELIKHEEAKLPYELKWRDEAVQRQEQVYYRILAKMDEGNYLVSNPIFANFTGGEDQVAALPPEPQKLLEEPQAPQVESPKLPVSPKAPVEPEVKEIEEKFQPDVKETESKNDSKSTLIKGNSSASVQSTSPAKKSQPEKTQTAAVLEAPKTKVSAEPVFVPEPVTPEVKEPSAPVEPKVEAVTPKSPQSLEGQPGQPDSGVDEKKVKVETKVQTSNEIGTPEVSKKKEPPFSADVKSSKPAEAQKEKAIIKTVLSKEKSQPESSKPESSPKASPITKLPDKRYVVALIDGVTLKKGPGVKFPEVFTAQKGERLKFIRSLNAMFNNKPWLEVQKGGRTVYVWGGLVRPE